MDKTENKLAGWEREFWKLLSPETARLLKADLNRPAAVTPEPHDEMKSDESWGNQP